MKSTVKNIMAIVIILIASTFSLSSCYETHYYHNYHHHTRSWYERRHQAPPAGVNFEVDIKSRRHRY